MPCRQPEGKVFAHGERLAGNPRVCGAQGDIGTRESMHLIRRDLAGLRGQQSNGGAKAERRRRCGKSGASGLLLDCRARRRRVRTAKGEPLARWRGHSTRAREGNLLEFHAVRDLRRSRLTGSIIARTFSSRIVEPDPIPSGWLHEEPQPRPHAAILG